MKLYNWIISFFITFYYLWKYGIDGTEKKLDKELYEGRMEYWRRTGKPWKGKL